MRFANCLGRRYALGTDCDAVDAVRMYNRRTRRVDVGDYYFPESVGRTTVDAGSRRCQRYRMRREHVMVVTGTRLQYLLRMRLVVVVEPQYALCNHLQSETKSLPLVRTETVEVEVAYVVER